MKNIVQIVNFRLLRFRSTNAEDRTPVGGLHRMILQIETVSDAKHQSLGAYLKSLVSYQKFRSEPEIISKAKLTDRSVAFEN